MQDTSSLGLSLGFGQPKVQQNDPALLGDFKIVRLNVAMNDLAIKRMKIDERIEQLIGPGHNYISRQRPWLLHEELGEVSIPSTNA